MQTDEFHFFDENIPREFIQVWAVEIKKQKKGRKKKRETQHLTRRTGRKFLSVPVRATVEILR